MKQIEWEKVKVVSWDIDGTFYDLHAFMAALKRDLALRAFTFRWISLVVDLYRLVRFKTHMDRVRKLAPNYPVGTLKNRDAIGITMARIYAQILPNIGALEGVKDLLSWVETTGRRQVVFSDYRQSTKIHALGLTDHFERVFAGEDMGHLKPSPLPFKQIIAELQIEPDQLLHIGDRQDTDGAAAQEVGFQVAIIGDDFETALELHQALTTPSTTANDT